jgi:hypothetical protein
MRSRIIFIFVVTLLRFVVCEPAAETPSRPSWYFPEPQLYEFAWGGKQKSDQFEIRSEQADWSPDEVVRFISHPSVDKQSYKWNPPASASELESLRGHLGNLPQDLERLLKISNGFFESPEEADFGFFKRNSNGSIPTNLNIEKTWTTRKSWSLLTTEQIIELKLRLDNYLSKVNQLVDLSSKWSCRIKDLRTDLIPIAYAPRTALLLCLKPDSDLLFVLANNEHQVDGRWITFHPGATDRIIVFPTNTRLQAVLDNGPCNDLNIVESDRAASQEFIQLLCNNSEAKRGRR